MDVAYGVFSPAQIEALESTPINPALGSKTPAVAKNFDGGHQANTLTIVLDFKEAGQGNTTDVMGNVISSFDVTSYGFTTAQFDTVANAILAEVDDDYFRELIGTVAGPVGKDLAIDFMIGNIGTAPVGITNYYFVQIGTGVSGPSVVGGVLGVAAGSAVRDSSGIGPNFGIQSGDVVASIFTNTIRGLGGITPSNALSSGNLTFTTNAISGTLSHEIGHTLSLSHINKAGSVQPTPGVSPLMGTGAIDLPNQDRLTDRQFSLSGFDGQEGNAVRQHVQQLVNAVGLHDTNTATNTAPVLNDQTLPSLPENSVNGTVVGTVVASDADANQTLTYSIIDGNTGNAFAINPTTGQITVNNRLAVDYETNPSFLLTVQVTDNGSPSKSDTGFVTINLNNLNDLDFGDLPDTFGTTLAFGGARHQTGSGLFLGSGVTNELNGQPSSTASLDADDGVTLPSSLTPGSNAQFTVTASQAGRLDVFIDFNGNGVFESTERITSVGGLIVNAGSNIVNVNVPSDASVGQRGARFRLSSIGGLDSKGLASDGEVEDYFVTVGTAGPSYDFGDLPDTFKTLLASDGPRHQTGGGLFLGFGVGSETDGKPSATANLDNDDGVTIPATAVSGSTAQFTLRASQAGKLDAFIDFNGNGVFDTNERVTAAGGLSLTAGLNTVTFNIPSNAVAGQRGARFRMSTAGGLAATGTATDGEVEDYFVTVVPPGPTYDYGDLPDSFGTTLANNGARHQTGSGLFLGNNVTIDGDGQPSAAANLDSDDGVFLPSFVYIKETTQPFIVRASQAGKLDAFIDFNANGAFDSDERVTPAGGLALTAGSNSITFEVPETAIIGDRGIRFRLSSTGGLAATGAAADGEVEDYLLSILDGVFKDDYGDLPDSFGTLSGHFGPSHGVGTGLFLGAGVTIDDDGQPSALADADTKDDGVIAPASLIPGSTAQFKVTASKPGKLDVFIDFNGNGSFRRETNERVTPTGGLALTAGVNIVSVNVPANAVAGQRGARFRFSSAGTLDEWFPAEDGEVEDYFVTMASAGPTFDFGDLPNTFGTLLADNGARHQTGGGLFLGTGVTSETDGQPSATANLDADDGVTAPASLSNGTNAQFTVKASQAGKLDAFIDFNGNGVFDTNERVTPAGGLAVTAGNNIVTVSVPSNAVVGQRGARFRLSTAGGLAAVGLASDGEVEDYLVAVSGPPTYDFGDLPDTFKTLLASDGPRHLLGSGLFLGTGVTSETDGKPSTTANLDTDDGVTAPGTLAPRVTAKFTVKASQAGKLDAFIDFNGNGVFESTERVTPAGGQALVAGTNTVNFTVPDAAVAGQRAARFRISTAGGLAATGLASDGEVEDYFVNVVRYDFGDLPNTFGTTLASNGARHQVGSGLFLGTSVTSEVDGQPSATASLDSDDGVTIPSTLTPRIPVQFTVKASKAGKLDAFIDFNGNGVFDANERITPAGGLAVVAGSNTINLTVPDDTVAGQRGARFRISTSGGLAATGVAADGEVEDYMVNVVRYDYGDLPDTFGTLLTSDGPRHKVGSGLFLGAAVTGDADGQPSALANLDSDDGVVVASPLIAGGTSQLTVTASKAGKLDAFIDFNGNGVFDTNERVTPAGGLAVAAGTNTVTVNVPANAVAGQRGARFRISTAGGLAAAGVANDGEVEDYLFNVYQTDFGDLPDSYGTTLANNGARHLIGGGLYLGAGVTGELNGQPSALANADTDDGVRLPGAMIAGLDAQITATASRAGFLDAFIDYNANGIFEESERVTRAGGQPLATGQNTFIITVPTTATVGQYGARFRLSSTGGLAATGAAADGEVEDYLVNVVRPAMGTVQALPDPLFEGKQLLFINGTNGDDTIAFVSSKTGLMVKMNDVIHPAIEANSRILVYGYDGNDKIALPTTASLQSYMNAGAGNDSIWGGTAPDIIVAGDGNDTVYPRGNGDIVYGGRGDDIIAGDAGSSVMFGEDGNDRISGHGVLVGGAGIDRLISVGSRNILIGGADADTLNAATNGDILIGGTTDFDTNAGALLSILTEWSAGISINDRIAHLTGAVPGDQNGPYYLVSDAVRPGTVHNDFAIDTITNTFQEDWLFVFSDDRRTKIVGYVNHA